MSDSSGALSRHFQNSVFSGWRKTFAAIAAGIAALSGSVGSGSAYGADQLSPGYSSTVYYTAGSEIGSFDWGSNGQLFYNNGWMSGDLYRVENGVGALVGSFGNFGGASVVAAGDSIFFNWSDYANNQVIGRYDIGSGTVHEVSTAPNYGLYSWNGALFITGAEGFGPNSIFFTGLDAQGNFNQPPVSISETGGATGPLGLDAEGNLYYSPGWGEHLIYRWSADEVSLAMSDPGQFALEVGIDSVWCDLNLLFADSFVGATSMAVDENGDLYLTLTAMSNASQLVKITGDGVGEVVLFSDGRLGEIRLHEGDLFVASGNSIHQIAIPEPSSLVLALGGVLAAAGIWRSRRRGKAGRVLLAGVLVMASAAQLHAGPYSQGMGDGENPYDPGIPGFVGPAGDGVISGQNVVNPLFLGWATRVIDYSPAPGVQAGFADPSRGLGPVTGDNFDIVSLGDLYAPGNAPSTGIFGVDYGIIGLSTPGSITLGFDYAITNGAGADFAVFENGFISQYTTPGGSTAGKLFAELAYVEVSTDGINFARFPSFSGTPDLVGAYGTVDPTDLYNLAGKHGNAYGISWGTPFNLDDLADDEFVLTGLVDLSEINFVRLVDIPGSGDFLDGDGNPIYDSWVTWGSGGFDFEALGVIHQIPEPSLGILVLLAGGLLVRKLSS